MLNKINKIKGLGLVFSDFSWDNATGPFKEVNVIYGWNGCGKTTLTRLFDHFSGQVQDIECELEIDTGTVTHANDIGRPIRVFNQHYIHRNVRVLEAQAERISVVLGADNQDLLDKIKANEVLLNGDVKDPNKPGLVFQLRLDGQQKSRNEKRHDTVFTDVARRVAALGGSGARRTYRSTEAKTDFARLGKPQALDAATLDQRLAVLQQAELEPVHLVEWPAAVVGQERIDSLSLGRELAVDAASIGGETPDAVVLQRLVENPDIAQWVEQGREIHGRHDPSVCEFCRAPITETRVKELALHFSDADRALKLRLDRLITAGRALYAGVDRWDMPDPARLYSDLRDEYQGACQAFVSRRSAFLEAIAKLGKALVAKRANVQTAVQIDADLDELPLVEALVTINSILERHNERSVAFQKVRDAAYMEVRDHYLSEIAEEVGDLRALITSLDTKMDAATEEIDRLKAELLDHRAQVSSEHKACDLLNQALHNFLGRSELRFRPEPLEGPEITAFGIYRGDVAAAHLSEGEKMAIAFVYFVVHLGDGSIPAGDGIVVIDDPISSLDTNSLYQAFAFLKSAVTDRHQVFVLTHNFDFLKLLLNWRERKANKTGYFMIANAIVAGARHASIVEMDKALREHESEYHYLFKRLKELRQAQDGTIAAAYPVPNMARKLWETFLMFRVPNSQKTYLKMQILKDAGLDPQKLDAIYKFTNDQSHITGAGFNPSLVPEAMNAMNAIFEMMEEGAPDHYSILDATTQ